MKSVLVAAVVLGVAGSAFHMGRIRNVAQARAGKPTAPSPVSAKSVSLPLYFEPNRGQTDPRVKFLARGSGYGLFLTADEAVLDLQPPAAQGQPSSGSVIRMHLDGASPVASVRGTQRLPGKSSYFIGNDPAKWRTNVPQFGSVEYQNVYPGIDLVYYGKSSERQLEYDFHVAPGAEPSQISLSIKGAGAHLDSGDLVLSTGNGDIRFRAPHVYQSVGSQQTAIPGSFRLLAENKVGFTVGPYDHSRELVIDPELLYSTYLGSGVIQLPQVVKVAVDISNNVYIAGSTNSTTFPTTSGAYQSTLAGAQNVFIAVLVPGSSTLSYATYLGGTGTDSLAGLAVETAIDPGTSGFDIYVAGTTTSADFPTSGVQTAFQAGPPPSGVHSFVTRLNQTATSQLRYSTYLFGTEPTGSSDLVTGLAADANGNAYVTGTTTSTNDDSNGFPANSSGFQICPYAPPQQPGGCVVTGSAPEFFASKIATTQSGAASMAYSTYFGGSNGTTSTGGGIAIDGSGNMYFTGSTNIASVASASGATAFPIFNAYQPCLNQPGVTSCSNPAANPNNTDAIVVKISPTGGLKPFYSTYLGGRSEDVGIAVAVDGEGNAYITGSTNSGDTTDTPPDWNCVTPCNLGPNPPFGYNGTSGSTNAFIAEITNQSAASTIYPLNYFAWLGGSGANGGAQGDIGQAIAVDSLGTVHLAGTTFSSDLDVNFASNSNYLQTYQGSGDAFVALVSPTASTTGDWITYLGGTGLDQGTGVAIDSSNNTYIAGSTTSTPSTPCAQPCAPGTVFNGFPVTTDELPSGFVGSAPNAFVSAIGSYSSISITVPTSPASPSPSPVDAGTQATFLYDVTNNGPDPASNVVVNVTVPTGFPISPQAKLDSGIGICSGLAPLGNTLSCTINNLAAGATAVVEVDVTPPAPPPTPPPYTFNISCNFSVNGGPQNPNGASCPGQQDTAVDFTIGTVPTNATTVTIQAGQLATFQIGLTPAPSYNGTITMSQSPSRAIVTNPSPTFSNPTVTLNGTQQQTTVLSIQTVARPVNTGSLFRRTSFYAAWLPIGGLSLAGLGIGAAGRRRRWIACALFGLLAGLLLLQPACSSRSNSVTANQGTAAGTYFITVTGSAATNASHQVILTLVVQ